MPNKGADEKILSIKIGGPCSGLNEQCALSLGYLNMWFSVGDAVGRLSVEEVCHWGWSLRVKCSPPSMLSLLCLWFRM